MLQVALDLDRRLQRNKIVCSTPFFPLATCVGILNPSDVHAVRNGHIGRFFDGGPQQPPIGLEESLAVSTTALTMNRYLARGAMCTYTYAPNPPSNPDLWHLSNRFNGIVIPDIPVHDLFAQSGPKDEYRHNVSEYEQSVFSIDPERSVLVENPLPINPAQPTVQENEHTEDNEDDEVTLEDIVNFQSNVTNERANAFVSTRTWKRPPREQVIRDLDLMRKKDAQDGRFPVLPKQVPHGKTYFLQDIQT